MRQLVGELQAARAAADNARRRIQSHHGLVATSRGAGGAAGRRPRSRLRQECRVWAAVIEDHEVSALPRA